MKRQFSERRIHRHNSLRIDVGLILLPKLGDATVAAELSRQGVQADVIGRVLYELEQRRSDQWEDGSGDRRKFVVSKFSWVLFWKCQH